MAGISGARLVWLFCLAVRDEDQLAAIEGEIRAPRESFVGLRYFNPPGGVKYCLNSKLAECTLRVTDCATRRTQSLHSAKRAAFEILTDNIDHSVEIRT